MGYYIRVFSTASECIPFSRLKDAVSPFSATLSNEVGEETSWEQLILSHADGPEIASIERNPAEKSSLGAEEVQEFRKSIVDAKPTSAAQWLSGYFADVRCVYACQSLSGTEHLNGWAIFGALKDSLWSFAPSIIQADGEGFSNEDGYHILWDFNDDVTGYWWMGILRDGEWQHFRMDLGDLQHREAFFRGEIPTGATLA